MTRPGDEVADLDAGIIERLRSHAADIAAAASVPARARADVIDELHGHLVDRTLANMVAGRSESDAADSAIAGFGGVPELAAQLSGAFHSRLWTSTIGVLLPAVYDVRGQRPSVIGWLRFVLGLGVLLTLVALGATIWLATPGHALVGGGLLAMGMTSQWLAFRALARGQRWALWYAILFTVELLVFGLVSLFAPEVPGSMTIPIGALVGIGILIGVHAAWDRLRGFVAGSAPIGRGLRAVLGVSLVGSALATPAMALVPDPTQATVDDLQLRVSVVCDHGDVTFSGIPTVRDVQRVTITADMVWRRSDVLPNGLDGLINPAHYGSSAGFNLDDHAAAEWTLVPQEPPVVDLATGDVAGWFGASSASGDLLGATPSLFTVGIDTNAIRGGRTLRATWLLTPSARRETSWPSIQVSYAHHERFLVAATAACGDVAVGEQLPMPTHLQGDAAPFGLP